MCLSYFMLPITSFQAQLQVVGGWKKDAFAKVTHFSYKPLRHLHEKAEFCIPGSKVGIHPTYAESLPQLGFRIFQHFPVSHDLHHEVIHHYDRREDRRLCPSYQGRLGFRVSSTVLFWCFDSYCCDVCRLLILKKPCLCTKSCTKGQGTDEACHLAQFLQKSA